MSLQPLGLTESQRPVLQALGNMHQALDAADARVQQSGDQVIRNLQEALNQSDKANRDLAGRLSQALSRMDELANRIETLESLRQTEKTASEERFNARIAEFSSRLAVAEKAAEKAIADTAHLKGRFDGHSHPYQLGVYINVRLAGMTSRTTSGPNN